MAMILYCDNKGCGKSTEAVLDLQNKKNINDPLNKIFCLDCNRELTNVTSFTKNMLKDLGQTKKAISSKESYAVKCQSCQATSRPVIQKDAKTKKESYLCRSCGNSLTLTAAFVSLLKEALGNKK